MFILLGFIELEPVDFYQIWNIWGSFSSQFTYITSFLILAVSTMVPISLSIKSKVLPTASTNYQTQKCDCMGQAVR